MKKACLLCDNATCGYKTGCVVVKGNKIIVEGWNETLPGEHLCQNGPCVREQENLHGGKSIERVCSIHAEANVVAQAAREGISLKGSDVYVTLFPCRICSKLLAKVGIRKLCYMSGYMGGEGGLPFFEAANISVEQISESEVWQR